MEVEEWTGDVCDICEIYEIVEVVGVVVEAWLYPAELNWLDSKGDQEQIEVEDGKMQPG